MQTVLITGVNGFVGQYLAALLADHYKVVGTGKGDCRLTLHHKNFLYATLDFTHENEVAAIIDLYQPHFIVHAGALSKPDDCELKKEAAYQTNVEATKNLLEFSAKHKSFFIFLSTDFVFDGVKGMYKEDDVTGPVNYYGQTKSDAEEFVKNYSYDWAIVRTVLVYGNPVGGRQNILTMVTSALKRGEEVKIFDDQVRTPTYVEDLVTAIKTIIDRKKTGIYHISGKDVLTPYQMAVAAAQYLGLDCNKIRKITEQDLSQPARRPLITGFDISKAVNELDYSPVSFETGLEKTFE
jgi:dTDP-4-dehydrorhamnose reductase